jgi:hypothetical protein
MPNQPERPLREPSYSYVRVPVAELWVDHEEYQRKDNGRSQRIADNYDEHLWLPPVVNMRQVGKEVVYAVIDGQARTNAARIMGWKTVKVLLWNDLDIEGEAGVFWKSQAYRSNLSAYDQYRARLCEGEEIAVMVARTVKRFGYEIVGSKNERGEKSIFAVQQMLHLCQRGLLERILTITSRAFEDDPRAVGADMLRGFNFYCAVIGKEHDETLIAGLTGESIPAIFKEANNFLGEGTSVEARKQALAKAIAFAGGLAAEWKAYERSKRLEKKQKMVAAIAKARDAKAAKHASAEA